MLKTVAGKVFVDPATKMTYGPIRLPQRNARFSLLDGTSFEALAEDSGGNYFTSAADGAILFWDHETDAFTRLANSLPEFLEHCEEPGPVEFDEQKVKSVWMDPAFARSIGRNVPKDGWIKKPKRP